MQQPSTLIRDKEEVNVVVLVGYRKVQEKKSIIWENILEWLLLWMQQPFALIRVKEEVNVAILVGYYKVQEKSIIWERILE